MSFELHRPPSGRRARPIWKWFGGYAITGLLLAGGGPSVRADNLDAALLKHAPEVMNALQKHHCRNVGVLKFRVHKPGHRVDFKAGPITDKIVTRLENALVAVDPIGSPVGVIRDAGRVAIELKLPAYDHAAASAHFFSTAIPLLGGTSGSSPT